jgi:hypothetical protein
MPLSLRAGKNNAALLVFLVYPNARHPRMTFRRWTAFGFLSAALVAGGCRFFAEAPPAETVIAAENGLDFFAARLSTHALGDLGFARRAELAVADVRQPFRIYRMPRQRLESYRSGDAVSTLIEATDRWLFPVVQAGEVRALISVDRVDGKPTAVAIGARRLAKALTEIRERWPGVQGYRLRYVRAAMADLVIVSRLGTEQIVPVTARVTPLDLSEGPAAIDSLYDPQQVVPRLLHMARQIEQSPVGG